MASPGVLADRAKHRRTRQAWEPVVRRGGVACWRCRREIVDGKVFRRGRTGPGRWLSTWVMGHPDNDHLAEPLPEHWACNARGATGKRVAARRPGRRRPVVRTWGAW